MINDRSKMYISLGEPSLYYLGAINALGVSATALKIISFRDLLIGWDYGAGGPIEWPIIHSALEWNTFLEGQGFLYTDAFPGGSGEIVLAAGSGEHYVEIIIEPDAKTISVAYDFKRSQVSYQLRKLPEEAKQIILEIMGQIWSASTSSIQGNITQLKKSGLGQLLGTTRVLYQSSDVNVLTAQGIQSANTYVNISGTSQELSASRPFFGNLKQIAFLRVEA